MSTQLRALSGAAVFAVLSLACGKQKLVAAPCHEDSACANGYLCDNSQCVPAETKACDVVTNGNPILEASPYVVEFGDLETPDAGQAVTLTNIGNCTLTIFQASLDGGAESPFSCDFCSTAFPIDIFPGRTRTVQVGFQEKALGRADDSLLILSDDREFPNLPVPIHANFLGVPKLTVAPNPVDFGYVAQGLMGKKDVTITNQGTGVATVTVQSVSISPASDQDFELSSTPTAPVTLDPVSADPKAIISFIAMYHPRSAAQHQAKLVIQTDQGEVDVPLTGNALTPPTIAISPKQIDLGQVPQGQTNQLPLTITNSGGSPLVVSYAWGGPNPTSDLFAVPSTLPPIAAGGYLQMEVAVTPTANGPMSGLLVFSSNDPANPSITIPVSATGTPSLGPPVVKVDMQFQGGSESTFDNDIRSVDMDLEDPYGAVCSRQVPSPTTWGNFGNPSWIAFGLKSNPQRVILANATQDGTYRVMLQYNQDCDALPSALTAGLLGISVDALIAYLTGGVGVPGVSGGQISGIIAQTCLDHSSTNATVTVSVNGQVIKETTATLAKMGDTQYAVDLVLSNGQFTAQ